MTPGEAFKLLSDDVHVFPQTPPWQQAMAAHESLTLANAGVGSAAELEEHLLLLSEFVQMLRDNLDALGPVLLNAAFLAGVRPAGDFETALPKALHVLSTGLGFDSLDAAKLKQAVQAFETYLKGFGKALPPPPGFSAETGGLLPGYEDSLNKAFTQGHEFAESHPWPQGVAKAWQQLIARMAAEEMGANAGKVGFDEVLCAARLIGPSELLPLRLYTAALPAWSQVLLEGMRPRKPTPADDGVPFAIVGHALLRSGFGRFDPTAVDSLCAAIQSRAGASAEQGAALRSLLLDARAVKRETTPTGSVVVVCKKELSITQGWTKVPTRALFLVLTLEQFKLELAGPAVTQAPSYQPPETLLTRLPSPVLVVWERPDEDAAAEADLRSETERRLKAQFKVLDPGRSAGMSSAGGADELVSLMRA